eukprot:1585760-Pleurochrysis_carterae.AAC.1
MREDKHFLPRAPGRDGGRAGQAAARWKRTAGGSGRELGQSGGVGSLPGRMLWEPRHCASPSGSHSARHPLSSW